MITVSSETTVDGSEDPLISDGEVVQNSNVVVVKQAWLVMFRRRVYIQEITYLVVKTARERKTIRSTFESFEIV